MSLRLFAIGVCHKEALAKVNKDCAKKTPGLGPYESNVICMTSRAHMCELCMGLGVGHDNDVKGGKERSLKLASVGIHFHVGVQLSHTMRACLLCACVR